jgi:L-malate glycosyltransferase
MGNYEQSTNPEISNRKKIHILHIFSTFNVGGTEVRSCDIMNNLGIECKHTIRIIKDGEAAKQLLKDTTDFTLVKDIFPTQLLKAINIAHREINKLTPDLIITYSWGAIEWVIANALFNHKPLIHAEDGFTDETPDRQKFSRLLFRRLFFRFASKVVVPALVLKKVSINKWFIPPNKVEYIPNGVDILRFKHREHNKQSGTVILGIIGTLYPVKNHSRLLNILSRIPAETSIQLWIIGSGPDMEMLKDTGEKLGITARLHFMGLRKDTEILLQQIDIFCLSSNHEQMPLTVLEAMASGLPVISTDVGDVKEMVSMENKPFVTPVDKDDLYLENLKTLITDADLRKQIGSANRLKCCEVYDNKLMYRRYEDLFCSLIK